ncbi:MAG TPA: hypothetical protein VN666_14325 [Nitrospira sp.]|nr:hypothetical protein [Nitrospira sp.]
MASSPVRISALEINQDIDVQWQTWTLQRISWAGMALIVLAALAGVFGSGPVVEHIIPEPLNQASASTDSFIHLKPTHSPHRR